MSKYPPGLRTRPYWSKCGLDKWMKYIQPYDAEGHPTEGFYVYARRDYYELEKWVAWVEGGPITNNRHTRYATCSPQRSRADAAEAAYEMLINGITD